MNNNLNPGYSNISNENRLLIDVLNNMYNDNLSQIHNFTNSINNLNESNSQIRNIFVQILSNQSRRRNNNTYNINRASRFVNLRENNSDAITYRYSFLPSTNNSANNNLTQLYDSFFQPIDVYPTQTQIESATRRVRYCDIISPKNRSCPILMEDFNDNDVVSIIRHCGHIFNPDELNRWFSSNSRCPVCRYDIRNYNSTASSEFFNNGTQNSVNLNRNSSSSHNEERSNGSSSIDDYNDNLIDNFINLYTMTDSSGNFANDASGNGFNNAVLNPSYLFRLLRRH